MKKLHEKTEAYMVRLFNCYTDMQKKRHTYADGIELYPSEIHAIERIAEMSTINLTDLAKYLGLTKGAISKSIVKLEQLGLVRRYKYVSNQKEVYLHLTEKGVQAYRGHKEYHAAMDKAMEQYCESVPDEKGQEILRFLDIYLAEMQKLEKGN